MDIITSTSNENIKKIKKLHQSKYRYAQKQFIVETWHLIEEAKKYNRLDMIITCDFDFIDNDITVMYVSDNVLKSISSLTNPSKHIGVVKQEEKDIEYNSDIVVLEDIQNPGNLGTILRNALAFNIKNIILSENCVDIYNEKVIQASQGAIFQLNIIKRNINEAILEIKENDYYLIGSSLSNAKSITNENAYENIDNKIALFFGNEGQGLKKETLEKMNLNYYIEIDNIDSLNVMSASAIFFYLLKQKR